MIKMPGNDRIWRILVFAVTTAVAVFLTNYNLIAAGQEDKSKLPENPEQTSPILDGQESPDDISEGPEGYHPEGRRVGTVIDVDRDLDFSFPKRDYVLPRVLPQKYSEVTDWTARTGRKFTGSCFCYRASGSHPVFR